jgi:hypothetical protein
LTSQEQRRNAVQPQQSPHGRLEGLVALQQPAMEVTRSQGIGEWENHGKSMKIDGFRLRFSQQNQSIEIFNQQNI